MKERETTPVVGKAAPQVIPSPDFVYRLVLDELFQNDGGRLPTDAFDAQETPIEPRSQEVHHVTIDGPEMRMVMEHAEKILAHRDNGGGTVRSHVQQTEQVLTRGFRRGLQSGQRVRVRPLLISGDGLV